MVAVTISVKDTFCPLKMDCKYNSASYLVIEILVMYVQCDDSHKEKVCKRHFHPSHPLKISPKYDIASYLVIEVLVMYVQKWWQLQPISVKDTFCPLRMGHK